MGCVPCIGSSKKEGSDNTNGIKEVTKESVIEGLASRSNSHLKRVSSDKSKSRSGNESKKETAMPKSQWPILLLKHLLFVSLLQLRRTLDQNVCLVKVVLDVFIKVDWKAQARWLR